VNPDPENSPFPARFSSIFFLSFLLGDHYRSSDRTEDEDPQVLFLFPVITTPLVPAFSLR